MKKVLGLSALALAGVLAFTGCGKKDTTEVYYGTYSYANPWNASGAPYGCQVKVSVKDGKVTKVELASDEKTGMVQVSATWTDKAKWDDNEASFLKQFEGKTVDEVLALEVTTADNGTPNAVTGINVAGKTDTETGATQSSGRVVKAVQDALREYKSFH